MKPSVGDVVFGSLVLLAGIGLVLAGIGTGLYQCALWLREGLWTAIELRDLTDGPPFHHKWLGLERIARWIGEQSVALCSVLAGMILAFAGSSMTEGR